MLIALVANIYDDATSINESKDKLISFIAKIIIAAALLFGAAKCIYNHCCSDVLDDYTSIKAIFDNPSKYNIALNLEASNIEPMDAKPESCCAKFCNLFRKKSANMNDLVKSSNNINRNVVNGFGNVMVELRTINTKITGLQNNVSTLKRNVDTLQTNVTTLKDDVAWNRAGIQLLLEHFKIDSTLIEDRVAANVSDA